MNDLCPALLRPCDILRGSGECQLCIAAYMARELRKIKDELKLLNARQVAQDTITILYPLKFNE